ncbi:hypothetical protein Tco_0664936 [Tanacetum coccineum]
MRLFRSLVSLINSLLLAKTFKHTLKHKKEELTLVELGSHLRIEESHRVQDSDKPKSNNVDGPSVVNMLEHNNSIRYNDNKGKRKHQDTKTDPNKESKVTCWKYGKPGHLKKDCKGEKVSNKANALDKFKVFKTEVELQQGSLIKRFRTDMGGEYMDTLTESRVLRTVVKLPDPKLKTLGERGIECIFVRYVEHSKAFRFYVIEPNESVSINSIIESEDAIFDENKFSSVPIPRTRDKVYDQHSYCFNVEDDPKTFDEAMKFQDMDVKLTFLNDKLDEEFYVNNLRASSCLAMKTSIDQVLVDPTKEFLSSRFSMKDIGLIMSGNEDNVFLVDPTKKFLSSRFSMKDIGEDDVILGIRIKYESNTIAISQSRYTEKVVSQLEYYRVIGCLMYAMTCTRPDIAFVVGKLSRMCLEPAEKEAGVFISQWLISMRKCLA